MGVSHFTMAGTISLPQIAGRYFAHLMTCGKSYRVNTNSLGLLRVFTDVLLTPLHRMGQPEEIASAALFLACEDSSFVAGAELSVDGGMAQI
jgi:NAD(P)-dependent dehydrogenase (short-subunit alcohol dehydrogenase family)